MSKKPVITFIVGSRYGRRSAKWIVYGDNEEVFVTTQRARKTWKFTIHASGRWHLKETGANTREGQAPLLRAHENERTAGGLPVCLCINIPDSSLRRASKPDQTTEPTVWLPCPEEDGVVQILLMKWDLRECKEEWPGQSAGVQLFGAWLYSEFCAVGLLSGYINQYNQTTKNIAAMTNEVTSQYEPIILDSPERRGYIFGRATEGALTVTEYAID